jgi:hypothetical protein
MAKLHQAEVEAKLRRRQILAAIFLWASIASPSIYTSRHLLNHCIFRPISQSLTVSHFQAS